MAEHSLVESAAMYTCIVHHSIIHYVSRKANPLYIEVSTEVTSFQA